MTYTETIEYLFNAAPLFQNIGAGAYKEGLSNTQLLDDHFGHPHTKYKTIHVAGTNGKGSTCHTIAAILQSQGYKVGLYTSPHLVDFRERIKVNGTMIPEERVIRFVEEERDFFEPLHPSFFELATALAFQYFAEEEVDWAVIEVGLGGRLDCTNIIKPELSIITNISFDHVQFLGNTLAKIASEKAGIIKFGTPVVIGEAGDKEVREVFEHKAQIINTNIIFAEEQYFNPIKTQLTGLCQKKNTQTILTAIKVLKEHGVVISEDAVKEGFLHVCELTGLMGRWQIIQENPRVICDTGHNVGGWEYLGRALQKDSACIGGKLRASSLETEKTESVTRIIIGMVNDKDVTSVMKHLPKDAVYYFTAASVKRAMPAEDFASLAKNFGLNGKTYRNVADAYTSALAESTTNDLIFIGGSTFIVADFFKMKGN